MRRSTFYQEPYADLSNRPHNSSKTPWSRWMTRTWRATTPVTTTMTAWIKIVFMRWHMIAQHSAAHEQRKASGCPFGFLVRNFLLFHVHVAGAGSGVLWFMRRANRANGQANDVLHCERTFWPACNRGGEDSKRERSQTSPTHVGPSS